MSDRLGKLFRNYWVLSVFCIVLGAALIADPHFFTRSISWLIGGLFAAYGVVYLIKYFINSAENNFGSDLVKGVILIAIGVFIIVRWEFIPNVIAISMGFYMLICIVIVGVSDGQLTSVHIILLVLDVILLPIAHFIDLKNFRKYHWYE